MLVLHQVSYIHPGKDILFSQISLTVQAGEKIALIGHNGAGKSTLLRIIAGELQPAAGQITLNTDLFYVPQLFGQYDALTVAEALRIADKMHALQQIISGDTSEKYFTLLNDDWTIEERSLEALRYFGLQDIAFSQPLSSLSGGQKTKLFLAAVRIHQPSLLLLDEPSNHLDAKGRRLLYDLIRTTKASVIVVSHDRSLLNLLDVMYELHAEGLQRYGGNYDLYREQKEQEQNGLLHDIGSKEKALRKAKQKERETAERQQKLDSRGKAKQEKAGVARIMMNTLRNHAENSTAKLKTAHAEKTEGIADELRALRNAVPATDQMKFGFDDSNLHNGKIIFEAVDIQYRYDERSVWSKPLTITITSGERILIRGNNGSGKTTLLETITGERQPQSGTVHRAENSIIRIDQDYSLLNNALSVYEQAAAFNSSNLPEHQIKIRLHRFLFAVNDWDKKCAALSGGERMRLALCCVTLRDSAPDIILLDEPTNNLDLPNVEILTAALNDYRSTLIVVSHDDAFTDELKLKRVIDVAGTS